MFIDYNNMFRGRKVTCNPRKNQRSNKLDSSMLKSKNQVNLPVNYSYNNLCSSENI